MENALEWQSLVFWNFNFVHLQNTDNHGSLTMKSGQFVKKLPVLQSTIWLSILVPPTNPDLKTEY